MNLLGVGSTTIKRWADDGYLPYYRTAGGHRRFRESAVRQLALGDDETGADESGDDETQGDIWTAEVAMWLQWLIQRDLPFIAAATRDLPGKHGDWFAAADFLGQVTQSIGQGWADNEWSVVEQHIATAKLAQAVSAVASSLPVSEDAPTCLVGTLTNEPHGLGILLAQLCLRARGLGGLVLGTNVPADELTVHLQRSEVALLALSASGWQTDAVTLARCAEQIGAVCKSRITELVLGGSGAWPEKVDNGYRCQSFADFHGVLDRVGL